MYDDDEFVIDVPLYVIAERDEGVGDGLRFLSRSANGVNMPLVFTDDLLVEGFLDSLAMATNLVSVRLATLDSFRDFLQSRTMRGHSHVMFDISPNTHVGMVFTVQSVLKQLAVQG